MKVVGEIAVTRKNRKVEEENLKAQRESGRGGNLAAVRVVTVIR